jgi:hypothetical protein
MILSKFTFSGLKFFASCTEHLTLTTWSRDNPKLLLSGCVLLTDESWIDRAIRGGCVLCNWVYVRVKLVSLRGLCSLKLSLQKPATP